MRVPWEESQPGSANLRITVRPESSPSTIRTEDPSFSQNHTEVSSQAQESVRMFCMNLSFYSRHNTRLLRLLYQRPPRIFFLTRTARTTGLFWKARDSIGDKDSCTSTSLTLVLSLQKSVFLLLSYRAAASVSRSSKNPPRTTTKVLRHCIVTAAEPRREMALHGNF